MFLDEALITVQGGHGGRGCVSFRREKFVPKGGPDGGNGGSGGEVFLVADENTDTLSAFISTKRFEAPKGQLGKGKNKNGKDGKDLILKVPPGTVVTELKGDREERIADLTPVVESLLIAHGGRGGYGNTHFKTSVRQKPDFAELGEPGESKIIKLELKMIADVGIIGYPSVGKSTLISVISSARPKIADYPFTTLVPNLGVVEVKNRSYIVCDVPGLIEGAHKGKGLGGQFLKHIERCGILLHMLDVSRALEGTEVNTQKLADDYRAVRNELAAYSPALSEKIELVILNKIDLVGNDTKDVEKQLKKEGITVFMSVSSATKTGTNELSKKLLPLVLKEREKRAEKKEEQPDELPVLKPHISAKDMSAFTIEKKKDGSIVVHGKRLEQFTKMTDFTQEGAIRRFKDVVERIGLKKVIEREKSDEEANVFIGDIKIDDHL